MKAAIIGAARRHNGVGEYIAKYFHSNGVEVACVLGSTEQSSSSAALSLVRYGINARTYADFSRMISENQVDCVAIASPSHTHRYYLEQCLDAGVHIFCEKPFVSPEMPGLAAWLDAFFSRAQENQITVAMNSQWPLCLPCYEELCGAIDRVSVTEFAIRLSPISTGIEMIPDSVPHALSLLYSALGSGTVEHLSFRTGDESLTMGFDYLTEHTKCAVLIEMARELSQPRTFSFGFNGRIAHRRIDLSSYTLHLTYGDKILKIADPLELSIRDFVKSARSGDEPLVGRKHIEHTAIALGRIYGEYARSMRETHGTTGTERT